MRRFAVVVLFLLSIALLANAAWAQSSATAVARPMPKFARTPFIAEKLEETDRTLADGNHIHHEIHTKIYNDSQGRSRTDTTSIGQDGVERVQVHVWDPTTNRNINWTIIGDEIRSVNINIIEQKTVEISPGERQTVSTTRDTQGSIVRSTTTTTDTMTTGAPQSPSRIVGGRFPSAPKPEDLGTREIEGFTAQGTRRTTVTPAGARGNSLPITRVHEIWISKKLGYELESTDDDPELYVRRMHLFNIQQVEPDPALFEPPAEGKLQQP